ncbi:putative aspartic-type endopeptidase [Podospora australis]|uniref:Aspartic-type endopeptidase n=1 Tax=Podospora australis TaxID=1536484 RepID=A0AAN6WVT7_9PEZI|nr:putative aspartic-type endopeptidase [Podospora australis]
MALSSFLSASLLLLGSLSSQATALVLTPHSDTQDDGCVHLPVVHSTNVNHFSNKRGVQLQLANRSDVAYYAQLSIGTPPQPVYVQLDTGSFELWVNPDCSAVSGADAAFCDRVGQYDTNRSSTANSLGTTKTLKYGIGMANITYFKDTISLAGSTKALQEVQFGVATASEDTFSGILGIGYGKGIATKYPNFVDQLYAQNATRVKAYTLALGSKDEKEGVIVFGGVDTSKFAGPLAKLPIISAKQSPDQVPRFWVDMKSIAITPPNNQTKVYEGSGMPVFLDSGSTMTLLPKNLSATIAKDFGANEEDANGFYRIDCGLTTMNGTLDFSFEGLNIKVPYKELIREVPSNPPACFLGITPSDSFTLLGDTFLRSAYAVFDLESDSIWMTQAANCGSTPAALSNVNDLSQVVGACGLTNTAVTISSTTVGAGTPSTGTPPSASGSLAPPNPASTSGAGLAAGAGGSTATSPGSRYLPGTTSIWSFGLAGLALFVSIA